MTEVCDEKKVCAIFSDVLENVKLKPSETATSSANETRHRKPTGKRVQQNLSDFVRIAEDFSDSMLAFEACVNTVKRQIDQPESSVNLDFYSVTTALDSTMAKMVECRERMIETNLALEDKLDAGFMTTRHKRYKRSHK